MRERGDPHFFGEGKKRVKESEKAEDGDRHCKGRDALQRCQPTSRSRCNEEYGLTEQSKLDEHRPQRENHQIIAERDEGEPESRKRETKVRSPHERRN
jgi:hypothetical protein